MKKLFTSSIFLIYAFILFFIIINVYIVFEVDIKELFDSYTMIYLFWFVIIILLKIVSSYITFEEDKHV